MYVIDFITFHLDMCLATAKSGPGTILKQHGMHHPEIPGDFSYPKLIYILRCCACTFARCADDLEEMLGLEEYDPEEEESDQHA